MGPCDLAYYPGHPYTGWAALVGSAATKVPSEFLVVVVVAVDDDHQTIVGYYYCSDPYEMAVVVTTRRDGSHVGPNDCQYYSCVNWADTMTRTRRR